MARLHFIQSDIIWVLFEKKKRHLLVKHPEGANDRKAFGQNPGKREPRRQMESLGKGEMIESEACGKGKAFERINQIGHKCRTICSLEVFGSIVVEIVAKKTVVLDFHTEFQLMGSAQVDLVYVAERYPLVAIVEIISGLVV